MTLRIRAYLFLIVVAAIWGSAGPIIKYTLSGVPPLPFLAYRFTISAIISLFFFLYKIKRGKKFKRFRANFPLVVLYGFLAICLSLGILFVGLTKSSVLDLTLVSIFGPLMVTLGGALFFKDHITKREKIGIIIVLLGVILNSLIPNLQDKNQARLTGNILLFLYLLADSSSILVSKKLVKNKVKSTNLVNFAFILGAITFIPLSFLFYGKKSLVEILINLPLKYHLGVWYMAILSGTVAYNLYIRACRSIEVSEAVLFNYLQFFFMVPLAIFWLKEKPSIEFILGGLIILIGLIISEYKKTGKKKSLSV